MINSTGIYKITNKINNKFYYGSTSLSFRMRWNEHKSELNRNIHQNKHLQNAWNKYGRDNFIFEIILLCPANECIFHEQQYLDWFWDNCNNCYNINQNANSSLGVKWTEESRKKMIGNKNGIGNKGGFFSDERRANLRIISSKRIHTQKSKDKRSFKMRGSKNPIAKLNETDIPEIVDIILNTSMTQKDIAFLYNVDHTLINKIINGKSWKHLLTDEDRKILKQKTKLNARYGKGHRNV